MTNLQEEKKAPCEHHRASALVLSGTKICAGFYGQLKDYSPMLKSSCEIVEQRVPSEWISKLGLVSDPALARLDMVEEKFVETVSSTVHRVSERVVTPVTTAVSERVLVPAKKLTEVEWKDLRGLSKSLRKKTTESLLKGFSDVKEFSAGRGKDIIHVDLIEYSREVIDNARESAKPYVLPVYENLMATALRASAAASALQDSVVAKASATHEQAEALRSELKLKLAAAIQAYNSLQQSGIEFVKEKYKALPEQYRFVQSKLPTRLQSSMQYILHSPTLLTSIATKADLTTSKRALDNVNSLIAAVREVIFNSDSPAEDPFESEEGALEKEAVAASESVDEP